MKSETEAYVDRVEKKMKRRRDFIELLIAKSV